MTAEERVEEGVEEEEEEEEVVVVAVKTGQQGQGQGQRQGQGQGQEEVEQLVERDGVVEEAAPEEVNVKQTFTPEEPQPFGPDESVLQEAKGDEEECGFCLFMKAGPCGKRFAAWEACVDNAETSGISIIEKCAQMTHYLKECMESNPEYYGPVLQAEKAMDEQAALEGSKAGDEKDNASNLESIPA